MTSSTDKVDELFAEWNRPDSPGCALAVVKDGKVIHKRGYGMADLERNTPIHPASVFDLGSTGKQFTAMLTALLARRGALSLDDSLYKYIPEMPAYEQPVTIRHLIHHTSGLRDYTTLMDLSGMHYENFYYEDELLDLICRQKGLNFKPGDEFLYNNTGYFLLGVIARRVTGKSLPELVQENILEPLGMHATSFNDDARRIVKDRAIGYSPKDGGGYCTEMSFCGGMGDGAILSTVEDLFLWDQNFYDNKLGGGGDELIQEVLTPGELNSGERLDYAFGLGVGDYRGLRKIEHAGAWAGYRSELIRFPDQGFSVICLANLNSINPSRLAQKVADLYLAGQYAKQQTLFRETTGHIDLPTHYIERITGSYRNQKNGNILKLSTQEGKLVGEAFGLSFPLVAAGSIRLKTVEAPLEIQIDFEEPLPETALTMSVKFEGYKPEIYHKMVVTPIVPSQLADYPGMYRSEELNCSCKVLLDGGQLFLKRGYSPKEALQPVTRDVFTNRDLNFQFERNEQDQVCAFRVGADRVRDILFVK